MRVYINPSYPSPDRGDGGIRRVVEAQQRYLPSLGWDIANSPDEADLIANHGTSLVERPGVPMVNHNHGLYWEDYAFGDWGDVANRHVIDVMVRAQAVTAPSQWVAHAIGRGMLVSPEVVYHGVDADDWAHTEAHGGYVLWNKARVDPVSDPSDMQRLANLLPDVPFVSTFGKPTPNVTITGVGSYDQMKPLIQRAGVYLATARETFGIGTLEALAAGVPVVGWDYGGQREVIQQGETGYLVPFGDLEGLADAVRRALADRARLSAAARRDAADRWGWQDKIQRYADLYTRVVQTWRTPRPKVSVVITAYNLAGYLGEALTSVAEQTLSDWECLIVDDCSTDDTVALAKLWTEDQRIPNYDGGTHITKADPRFRYLRTPENLGLSGARNYGWQHAKGKYILFLDADDQLTPNALDLLAGALDHDSSIHIAYGGLDIVNHDGQERKQNPWPAGDYHWQAQIAHLNQLPYCSMMRREVLERSGGYRTRDWRAEDASFWSRVTSFGFRAAHATGDTCLIYRLHSAQKSRGEDSDGDWTAWLPWRVAGEPRSGFQAIKSGAQPNARLVPFGAQGEPAAPRKAWPVRHHQHPVVSVIIPVGPGHQQYLIDALDSVQAQTMPEWECIVVDDSGESLDLTPWPWVQLIHIGQAHGAGEARNEGLRAATAPLVLFLDADDVLVPRALELLLKGYADSGGRYAYSDWLTLEDERRIDGPMERHDVEEYDARAMLSGLRHAVTALIPADWARAVGGFDEQLPVFEDWDFYCKLAASGYCGVRVAQPLLIYRRQSGLRTRMALRPRASAQDAPAYTPLGEQAASAIIDRFTPWTSGQEAIMGCCGGSAPVVQITHEALNDMLDFATGGVLSTTERVDDGKIRMEFIGDQLGAQSYYGKGSGLLYRAGREMGSRFHDVDPRDVEYFLSLGLFRVVAPEPLMAAAVAEPEMAVLSEPRVQGRVKGRRAAD